jgi:hypothetical protein
MPSKKPTSLDAETFAREIGDPDLALFYLAWLKNGQDATKAYAELHPNVTHGSAQVLGHRWLSRVKPQVLMATYNLGYHRYFTQLAAGLDATKWNDFTGEREDDHAVRRPYHDKLGKILGIEQNANMLIQVNNQGEGMTLEFFDTNGHKIT